MCELLEKVDLCIIDMHEYSRFCGMYVKNLSIEIEIFFSNDFNRNDLLTHLEE